MKVVFEYRVNKICNYMYFVYIVSIYNYYDVVNILVYVCICIILEYNL